MIWKCFKHVTMGQLFIELPMMTAFHPVATSLGMQFLQVPFPSWTKMIKATLFFLFMEDFYQYFAHRLLHYGIFYKKIHKIHHEHAAPFGLASQYAHPLETLILGVGFFIGPLLWVYVTKDLHVVTMAFWLAVRLLQVVDAHSGYDFPWSLHHFLPFWSDAIFHDYHQ
jgi:methylsterol monooxygenase